MRRRFTARHGASSFETFYGRGTGGGALGGGGSVAFPAVLPSRLGNRTRGFAAVLVLHDINMAADHADRIVALRSGRVIADDTPARIMTPAQLRAIYGIEMEVTRSAAGRIRAFAA